MPLDLATARPKSIATRENKPEPPSPHPSPPNPGPASPKSALPRRTTKPKPTTPQQSPPPSPSLGPSPATTQTSPPPTPSQTSLAQTRPAQSQNPAPAIKPARLAANVHSWPPLTCPTNTTPGCAKDKSSRKTSSAAPPPTSPLARTNTPRAGRRYQSQIAIQTGPTARNSPEPAAQ